MENFERDRLRADSYVRLGAVLGVGYLFKTAFFPLSLALIILLFLFPPAPTWSRRKLLVACLVLLLVCLPWAAAVSRRLGTLSIGEAGRLNYIWYANHQELAPYLGWDGRFGSVHSTLRHPPRMLMNNPVVMEFAARCPARTHSGMTLVLVARCARPNS
jgi:4-amino-4-deoxy-L-arabinose transferase-like glycosyltransferase